MIKKRKKCWFYKNNNLQWIFETNLTNKYLYGFSSFGKMRTVSETKSCIFNLHIITHTVKFPLTLAIDHFHGKMKENRPLNELL